MARQSVITSGISTSFLIETRSQSGSVNGAFVKETVSAGAPYTLTALTRAVVAAGKPVTLTRAFHGAWDSNFPNDGAATYSNNDRTATMASAGYPSSIDSRNSGTSDLVYAEISVDVSGAPA